MSKCSVRNERESFDSPVPVSEVLVQALVSESKFLITSCILVDSSSKPILTTLSLR